MNRHRAYFFIGGDLWYTKYHGEIKDLRFYPQHTVPPAMILCNVNNELCKECDENLRCK